MINAPRAPQDQTAQFAEMAKALQAQIKQLEQRLNAAPSEGDSQRSAAPLKPNRGEAAPRRGTKPIDDAGDAETGDDNPPDDVSMPVDASAPDEPVIKAPDKPRMREIVVVFAFRDAEGRMIRSQRGKLTVAKAELREQPVVGQTEFKLLLPDDGQKHRFDFRAMKSGYDWLPGFYTVDPDESRIRIQYTCRR
jgi:hypothetical protein